MQGRLGPNRVGPGGLLQAVADAIKLLTKEIIIPGQADRVRSCSRRSSCSCPRSWSGRSSRGVPAWPSRTSTSAVLFVLALGALPTIGILMAGLGSGNKYAVLGGMRAAAQLISYEIPMVLIMWSPSYSRARCRSGGIVEEPKPTSGSSSLFRSAPSHSCFSCRGTRRGEPIAV